jgi:hypothetical protein
MSVVVFGGNGFVGSNVLKALVARGVPAVSVSRGGDPPPHLANAPWARRVKWTAGDALEPKSYAKALQGFEKEDDKGTAAAAAAAAAAAPTATEEEEYLGPPPQNYFERAILAAKLGSNPSSDSSSSSSSFSSEGPVSFPKAKAVVVCIGTPPLPFVDEAWQTKMNGGTNCTIVAAAAAAGVSRVVLVNALMPSWAPPGYRNGKMMAEDCARKFVEEAGAASAVASSSSKSSTSGLTSTFAEVVEATLKADKVKCSPNVFRSVLKGSGLVDAADAASSSSDEAAAAVRRAVRDLVAAARDFDEDLSDGVGGATKSYLDRAELEAAAAKLLAAKGSSGGGGGGRGGRGAVVLKPGAVYGTRHTPKRGLPIPLAPVMAPVAWALKESNPLFIGQVSGSTSIVVVVVVVVAAAASPTRQERKQMESSECDWLSELVSKRLKAQPR